MSLLNTYCAINQKQISWRVNKEVTSPQKRCYWSALTSTYYLLKFPSSKIHFYYLIGFQYKNKMPRYLIFILCPQYLTAANVSLRQDKYLWPGKEGKACEPEGMKSGWLRTGAGKSLQKGFLALTGTVVDLSHGLAREEPIIHIDLKPSLLQNKAGTWYPCANPACAIAHLWTCAISAIRWQFICKCPSSQMCLHLICECTGI